VTEQTIPIERKGIDAYSVKNYLRLFCSSNNERAIPAEVDERRYAVFEISQHRKQDRAWFARFLREDLLPFYLDEFLAWEIESDLTKIPQTKALLIQKLVNSENKPEYAFLLWVFDKRAFWTKGGEGKEVSWDEVRTLFFDVAELKLPPKTTWPSLQRKLGYILKKYIGVKGYRKTHERGFVVPPFDTALENWQKLYGVDKYADEIDEIMGVK
jgi:hypothetical protein